MATVRCPMPECRRRVDLDDFEAIPAPPAQPASPPCLHFVAAWDRAGGPRGEMAEAVMWGLATNREFLVRNLRPKDMRADRIEQERPRLEWVAHQHAHVVLASDGAAPDSAQDSEGGPGALFADRHEANHVAREYARYLLGDDAVLGGGSI